MEKGVKMASIIYEREHKKRISEIKSLIWNMEKRVNSLESAIDTPIDTPKDCPLSNEEEYGIVFQLSELMEVHGLLQLEINEYQNRLLRNGYIRRSSDFDSFDE